MDMGLTSLNLLEFQLFEIVDHSFDYSYSDSKLIAFMEQLTIPILWNSFSRRILSSVGPVNVIQSLFQI